VLVTSRAVLLDIGNASSTHRYLQVAVHFWTPLGGPHAVGVAPLSERLYTRAAKLYRERDINEISESP